MVCQPLRLALLIGTITAVAVSPAQAFHGHRAPASGCCDPCATPATTAPAFRTITCTEWVRETYQVKRTSYRTECRTETVDSVRTECVPEVRDRVVTCIKRVPIVKEEIRKVCHKVTVYEDRVVNRTSYKYVQETCMKKKLVRCGHWECREVACLFGGHGHLFGGHHGNSCDPCADPCAKAPRTRTKKVWVHCPEYQDCPYTVCKKVCVTEAVTCKVPVCRTEWRDEKVRVCSYQCIEEKRVEKCTVYVARQVPCKVTRTVRVCVPCEETVTCCKMVPRTVTRQVACPAPVQTCAPATNDCCESPRHRCGLFNRGGHGHGHLRGNSDCCRPTSCCN